MFTGGGGALTGSVNKTDHVSRVVLLAFMLCEILI